MDEKDRAILEEIRDIQREHLAQYKRVTEKSLALQQEATDRQRQITSLYRKVLVVAAVVVAGLVAFLATLGR